MKKVYHHVVTLTLVFQGFEVYTQFKERSNKCFWCLFIGGSGIISNIGYPKFSMKSGTSGVIQNWWWRLWKFRFTQGNLLSSHCYFNVWWWPRQPKDFVTCTQWCSSCAYLWYYYSLWIKHNLWSTVLPIKWQAKSKYVK